MTDNKNVSFFPPFFITLQRCSRPRPVVAKRHLEFFTAQIHARKAYLNATRRFAD
jgi:hypothetical protein